MAINEAVLTSFYDHGRSDHTDGALAVKYLSAEVGVGRGAESFAENGGVCGEWRRCTLHQRSQIDGLASPPPTVHLNAGENRNAA